MLLGRKLQSIGLEILSISTSFMLPTGFLHFARLVQTILRQKFHSSTESLRHEVMINIHTYSVLGIVQVSLENMLLYHHTVFHPSVHFLVL